LINSHQSYTINFMKTVYLHGFAAGPGIWDGQKPGFTPQIDFSDLEAESHRLSSAIGPETILIGWSMGGMVALKTALLSPGKVKALVLVSTTPKFVSSPDYPYGLPLALLRNLKKKIKLNGVKAFHSLAFKDLPVPGLIDTPIEQAEKELAELEKVDLRELLAKIEAPTLIIHGNKDQIVPVKSAEYLAKNISGSELHIYDKVGHAPFLERSKQFNQCIRNFINKI